MTSNLSPLFHRDPRSLQIANTSAVMDGTTIKHATIIRIPKTGSISTLTFYFPTVTSAQTLKASLYQTTISGTPSTAQVSATATPTANYVTFTFSTPQAVNNGNTYAVVLEWNSTAGNLTVQTIDSFSPGIYMTLVGSTWTIQNNVWMGCLVGYSDGTYPAMMPVLTRGSSAINIATNLSAVETGLYWTPAANYELIGAYVYGSLRDCKLTLYNSSNTILAQDSWNPNWADTADRMVYFPLTNSQLSSGTAYRLVITPNGTNASRIYQTTFLTNTQSHLGVEPLTRLTSRGTVGGSWTDPINALPSIIPVFGSVSVGSGGGWNGGING